VKETMRAKTLERLLYASALAGLAVPFALPYLGLSGFRGGLHKIVPKFAVAFFVVAMICGAFVTQERRKLEAISDDQVRDKCERALARKIGFIGIALALALLCGYFLGQQF
jgi:hypothetical protein